MEDEMVDDFAAMQEAEAQAEFDRYCEETEYDYYEELADQHFLEYCQRNGLNPEDY